MGYFLLGSEDSYLDFRNDRTFLRAGTCKSRQRGWRDHGVGPGEVTEVTAWDLVLFVPHDYGFHHEEAIPGQPQRMLLGDEGSPLKVQDNGDPTNGDEIEAVLRDGT